MLEVDDAARAQLEGLHVRWVRLAATGKEPGDLPDPSRAVPDRDPATLSEDRVAEAYRKLFWSFDIDPTKQRPAGEALARRVAQGKGLPSIHPVVDAYNLASAATLVPISAFDTARLEGTLQLALAEEGDTFDPIGGDVTEVEPGRPVLRDDAGIVSLLAYRDCARTAIGDDTEEIVCVTCGPTAVGPRVLPEALRTLESYASIAGWRFASSPEGGRL